MSSVLIFIIGVYASWLANPVFGNICPPYPTKHGILHPPFQFDFSEGSQYNMLLHFKNLSPQVTRVFVTVIEIDDPERNATITELTGNELNVYRLCGTLTINSMKIWVDLYSSKGRCASRLVSEARKIETLQRGEADLTYKSEHLCLKHPNSACEVMLDFKEDCIESQTNQNDMIMTNDDSTTSSKRNISNETWILLGKIADSYFTALNRNRSDYPQEMWNFLDTIQNKSVTPNATNIKENVSEAETKTYIIAIASAVSGIALTLLAILAILAIKKRWCIKGTPSGTPVVQRTNVTNPFYVNLLFRKECAEEIERIENHIYEEIDPQ